MAKTGAADATGKPTAWMVAALLVTHGVAKIHNSLKKLFTGFSFWLGPGVGVSPTGTVICYVVSAAFHPHPFLQQGLSARMPLSVV